MEGWGVWEQTRGAMSPALHLFGGCCTGALSLRTADHPVRGRAGDIHGVSMQVLRQKKNHPRWGPRHSYL